MTVQQIREKARADAASVIDVFWDETFPVDPIAIARRAGLSVFDAQLGEDTWGMIIGNGDGSADIYLDLDQGATKRRFSCAHELGHYFDRMADLSIEPGMGFEDKRSEEGRGTADEVYANEFAASLLMPESRFRALATAGVPTVAIAAEFGVSPASASYRRQLLGV